MSSSTITTLNYVGQQIYIYAGSAILIAGVVGGCLNLLVFFSLRTFRQSSCAFYLIVISFFNMGQLVTGLFRQIMISGFAIDWTVSSLFYCKVRPFLFQSCMMVSLTSMCFATVDQYWATCHRPNWQRWCHIKLAHLLSALSIFVWHTHAILYLVFMNHVLQPAGSIVCVNTSNTFQQYIGYVLSPVIGRAIPISVTFTFGVLAYINTRQIAYRTVPLVRRELDMQLTTMVMVQVVFTCFAISPALVIHLLISYSGLSQDPLVAAQLQFGNVLVTCLYYTYFASPFYIYLCVSERFRRQFIYVISRAPSRN